MFGAYYVQCTTHNVSIRPPEMLLWHHMECFTLAETCPSGLEKCTGDERPQNVAVSTILTKGFTYCARPTSSGGPRRQHPLPVISSCRGFKSYLGGRHFNKEGLNLKPVEFRGERLRDLARLCRAT